jgi:hypothetical protein
MNKQTIAAAVLAFGGALIGSANADSWDNAGRYQVTVENRSGYTIENIYMSSTNDTSWERDLLGSSELLNGYHTTVFASAGHYDIRLVDRDHDQCVVNNVEIRGDRTLAITAEMLLRCEGYDR